MRFKTSFMLAAVCVAASVSSALADTTVTITSNTVDCKVSAPEEVATPATPSAAAGIAAEKNHNYALARANFKAAIEAVPYRPDAWIGLGCAALDQLLFRSGLLRAQEKTS